MNHLTYFAEIQWPVSSVENTLYIVRIKQETIFLPSQIGEGRIGLEVAVQSSGSTVGKIDFSRWEQDLGLI
jgi:hypothetical protein